MPETSPSGKSLSYRLTRLSLVILVISAAVWYFGKVPPKDELVRGAVEYYVKELQAGSVSRSPYDGTNTYLIPAEFHYPDAAAFLAKNPDCCTFTYRGSDGWLPSGHSRFYTGYVGVVTIVGKRFSIDRTGEVILEDFSTEIAMNRNGNGIDTSGGWEE